MKKKMNSKNIRKALLIGLAICLATAFNPFSSPLVYASSKGDVAALRAEVDSLRKDMDEIKRVLISLLPALVNGKGAGGNAVAGGAPAVARDMGAQNAAPPANATIAIGDSPSLGNEDAVVAIIEFSDYECPFCSKFHSETYKDIKKDYVDTGKVRFIHKDLPLPFHQNAEPAALASRCAGDQGKYWQMNHALYVNAGDLSNLEKIAKSTGLKMSTFKKCMEDQIHRAGIAADLDEGRLAGVRGTPTFIVGRIVNGTVSGEVIPGAAPYAMFKDKLDRILTN